MHKVLVSSNSFGLGAKIDDIKAKFDKLDLIPYFCKVEDAGSDLLESIDGLIVGTNEITSDVIDRMKKVKSIVKYGVGTNNIDIEYAQKRCITIRNLPAINSHTVAEFTIGMMFSISRKIPQGNDNMRHGKFVKVLGDRVTNKTIGVIGTGSIGKEVAKMCKGLGMNVLIYDTFKDEKWAEPHEFKYIDLYKLIAESDFITVHVPLTPETRNLIDEKEIKLMKKSVYLLNMSRGGIINESALYNALVSQSIAGAALDVFNHEPPLESPLIKLDNVVATPHMAAHTNETLREMDDICIKVMANTLKPVAE